MARCMLIQSKLPKSLWVEAINTAAFIRNRCPSKQLDDVTPMELWSNKKPYVGFMRIFGSRVIALNKGPRRSKLEPKGESYLLVGYSNESKAYRLWKPGTRKVIKQRDVRFNEKLSEENTKKNDYLETPLNLLEMNSKPADEEIINEIIEKDTNVEDIIEKNEEQNEDQTSSQEEETINDTTIKRAPGRPKILRTGKRGRPRKLFNETTNLACANNSHEPYSVEDIFGREDEEL